MKIGANSLNGSLSKLKKQYDYLRKITVITKDKLKIEEEYVIEEKNLEDGIEFIIDIRKIEINEFIKLISSKISIIDIDVDSGNLRHGKT